MKFKKLRLLCVLVTGLVVSSLIGCGTKPVSTTETKVANTPTTFQTDYLTYEFETFDGRTIMINSSNIISQQTVDDVLETTLVPSNADIIAPGRDYVYLEDEEFFYVEDAANNLLTIARKDNVSSNSSESSNTSDRTLYECDCYQLSYQTDSFQAFGEAENNSITLSYCREGVASNGTNALILSVADSSDPKAFIEEAVEAMGGDASDVTEVSLSATPETCYLYSSNSESTDSGIITVQTLYAIPCKERILFIKGFRTVGTDDITEMTIDSDFEFVLQSLTLK